MRRRQGGIALVATLVFVLCIVLWVAAEGNRARDLTRAATRRREVREQQVLLDTALAICETRLRHAWLAGSVERGTTSEFPLPVPTAGWCASLGPGSAMSCTVRPLSEPGFVRATAREASDGRPTSVIERRVSWSDILSPAGRELLLEHLDDVVVDGVEVQAASLAEPAWRLLAEACGYSGHDGAFIREELKRRLAAPTTVVERALAEQVDALLLSLQPLTRLVRTNSHPSRTMGLDRGRIPAGRSVLALRPLSSFHIEVSLSLEARTRSASRVVEVERFAHWDTQESWLQGSIEEPRGVQLSGALRLGPERTNDGTWIVEAPRVWPLAPGVDVSRLRWRVVPGAAIGVGDRWWVVVTERGVETTRLPEPVLPQVVQIDARHPRSWFLRTLAGHHLRVTGPVHEHSRWERLVELPAVVLAPLDEFPGRQLLNPELLPADGETVATLARALLVATSDELLWFPVRRSRPRHLDLGGHLLLAPTPSADAASFRAPLDTTLVATAAGYGDDEISPEGTINSGASVLRAPDLGDFFVDGVYSSPLRRETLRYRFTSDEVGAGAGQLLIKPERSAPESPEPYRERIVLRLTQQLEVSFHPGVEWLRSQHPDAPLVDPVAFAVTGDLVRRGELVVELVRLPSQQVWFLRRHLEFVDPPWSVTVVAGDPPRDHEPWTIDGVLPGHDEASEMTLADERTGGLWQRLSWESWPVRDSSTFDDAFAVELDDVVLEIGGELGAAKAFRGTIREVRLGRGSVTDGPLFAERGTASWWLPEPLAGGSRLLSLRAFGEFAGGVSLNWKLTLVESAGRRVLEGQGRVWRVGESLADDTRIHIALTLVSNDQGSHTPLVEGVRLEWMPAPAPCELGVRHH